MLKIDSLSISANTLTKSESGFQVGLGGPAVLFSCCYFFILINKADFIIELIK